MSTLTLADIPRCLLGLVPSSISSCSASGVPNVTHVSQIHGVDDRHVAVSNQFLSKTQRNVQEHPYLSALVLDPGTGSQYVLDLEFVRAETSGPLFDELSDSIDAIASVFGMQAVFRLRSADVYLVQGLRELTHV